MSFSSTSMALVISVGAKSFQNKNSKHNLPWDCSKGISCSKTTTVGFLMYRCIVNTEQPKQFFSPKEDAFQDVLRTGMKSKVSSPIYCVSNDGITHKLIKKPSKITSLTTCQIRFALLSWIPWITESASHFRSWKTKIIIACSVLNCGHLTLHTFGNQNFSHECNNLAIILPVRCPAIPLDDLCWQNSQKKNKSPPYHISHQGLSFEHMLCDLTAKKFTFSCLVLLDHVTGNSVMWWLHTKHKIYQSHCCNQSDNGWN